MSIAPQPQALSMSSVPVTTDISDLLRRRQTHFVFWDPAAVNQPVLVIGQLVNGNPASFQQKASLSLRPVQGIQGLWELPASECDFAEGQVYHYWFEINDSADHSKRIQITDPFATGVDYRLASPLNPLDFNRPASVIGWEQGRLIACDPEGETEILELASFQRLPSNDQLVIYELPTAWTRTSGNDQYERATGTFRDVRALMDKETSGANFAELNVTKPDNAYLVELGINALEMLPPADSIYSREWGYGTSHYFAPDFELGFPDWNLSPTPNQDLTALVNTCHQNGIRVILDVVMGFMKDDPYSHIDFNDFYLDNPCTHSGDPDAYTSRDDGAGGKVKRNPYGGSCPRYATFTNTYDPISGQIRVISPARQYMLTYLTRWMQDFQIDGIRMDSVENVANWDFIQTFREEAHKQFRNRYETVGEEVSSKFLVVGEELSMPKDLLTQNRLDALWNDRFQRFIRAALLGEHAADEASFEWTVRRAIDCGIDGLKSVQVVNYLTSHDVEGFRKERLYNLMEHIITLNNSSFLFNRDELKGSILNSAPNPCNTVTEEQINKQVDQMILHLARLRRIKLGFACLLTSVGIPMILAGEEFGDQSDLFDSQGQVSNEGGKQVDPVDYSRKDEKERSDLLDYVKSLVHLRTSEEALWSDDVAFIHRDFNDGKRVMVWKRGTIKPVIVVANFSDYTTPGAPDNGEYYVPNWPAAPEGFRWFEVTQNRFADVNRYDREPIFAWEAKVYCLAAKS